MALLLLAGTPLQAQAPAIVNSLAGVDVRALEIGEDGTLWLATRDHGLGRWDGSRLTWDLDVPLDGVADVRRTTSGLWVSGLGGAAQRVGDGWLHHPDPAGLGSRVLFTVTEAPDGGIWVGGTAGAARWDGSGWSEGLGPDARPHAVVHQVLEEADGTVWYACRRGLARVGPEGVRVEFTGLNLRVALRTPDDLWFGTSDGVLRRVDGGWERALEGRTVLPSGVGPDGTIWAGGTEGLFRWRGGDWEPVSLPERFAGAEVHEVVVAPDGTAWVATSRGLWAI